MQLIKPTRRSFLRSGAAFGTAALIGINPKFSRPAYAQELAPGMTGGPTGFPGCERFQYNETHSEGRAIEAMVPAVHSSPDSIRSRSTWLLRTWLPAPTTRSSVPPDGSPTISTTFPSRTPG